MASLAELARAATDLDGAKLAHLQRLVAVWGLLADFCFADLLLYGRTHGSAGPGQPRSFVVLGQIRPATSQTVYRRDWVGTVVTATDRPIVDRTFSNGEIIEGELSMPPLKEPVRVLGIPVRWQGEVIAVLTRESAPSIGRSPGELERTYVDVFNRFARMISSGEFPFAIEDPEAEEAPRVGDGVIVLGNDRRVTYSSPNAVSALHRVGVHANAEGLRLSELGLDETAVDVAFTGARPALVELDGPPDVTVVLRCIPLLDTGTSSRPPAARPLDPMAGRVSGAVVLLRDISELRRRDRLLLSKDATIREIHHRVKNNLQTISSLLRLQGRRLASGEAKEAIEESVRRVRSIALVHEILSREAGEDVEFTQIVRPICRMVEDAFRSSEHPVRCVVEGEAGELPAQVATPLAVVLNELLQNAFDHAYPDQHDGDGEPGADGCVSVQLSRLESPDGDEVVVRVVDDGVGLPEGFTLESAGGLGLSIVRTLVTGELSGHISLDHGDGQGSRPGTAAELRVPVAAPGATGG